MSRKYTSSTLQKTKNKQYLLTIPAWCIEKVLVAKKGDKINFDFEGSKLILTNGKKTN